MAGNLYILLSLHLCTIRLPTDFGSLFDLEHDLPDELINSSELGLVNGGDINQLHPSMGGGPGGLGPGVGGMGLGLGPGGGGPGPGGGGQDAVAKHKQLSELLRSGAPPASTQQGHPGAMGNPGGPTSMGQHLGNMKASPCQGPQQHLSSQQQASMMQQQQQQNSVAGMVGSMSRAMMGAQQKGNNGPQQQPGMMGGQVMNGSPRMGFGNQGMGGGGNLLAETLQQQQQVAGPQAGMRGQQPGALNKVKKIMWHVKTKHRLLFVS